MKCSSGVTNTMPRIYANMLCATFRGTCWRTAISRSIEACSLGRSTRLHDRQPPAAPEARLGPYGARLNRASKPPPRCLEKQHRSEVRGDIRQLLAGAVEGIGPALV